MICTDTVLFSCKWSGFAPAAKLGFLHAPLDIAMDRLFPDSAFACSVSRRRGCRALFELLVRWRSRALNRRQLQQLDGRALADLGLTLADQYQEGGKPCWRE